MERRRERFCLIYMFKILNNLVPNPGIEFEDKGRRGIEAKIPTISNNQPTFLQNLRRNSFNYFGPRLWNTIPTEIRSYKSESGNGVLGFKNQLDQYLSRIPDEPSVLGLQRAAASNSICDQKQYITNN